MGRGGEGQIGDGSGHAVGVESGLLHEFTCAGEVEVAGDDRAAGLFQRIERLCVCDILNGIAGLVLDQQAVRVGAQRVNHILPHHVRLGHGFIGALTAAQDGDGIGVLVQKCIRGFESFDECIGRTILQDVCTEDEHILCIIGFRVSMFAADDQTLNAHE